MTQNDFPQFSVLVTDMAGCYPKQVTLTAGMLAMMFRALAEYPLDAVRAAMDTHLKHPADCKFFPLPGQLIGHITSSANNDGRLGAEEAWALALTARDEADTVVWTDEIARAWNVARTVYAEGDEVGARMAFKEAYARIVAEARAARQPLAWIAAEGFDPARRLDAVRKAAAMGRLPANSADILAFPLPDRRPAPLLAYAAGDARAVALARLQAVRDKLTQPPEYVPSAGALAIAETNARRQEAAESVAAYTAEKAAQ